MNVEHTSPSAPDANNLEIMISVVDRLTYIYIYFSIEKVGKDLLGNLLFNVYWGRCPVNSD